MISNRTVYSILCIIQVLVHVRVVVYFYYTSLYSHINWILPDIHCDVPVVVSRLLVGICVNGQSVISLKTPTIIIQRWQALTEPYEVVTWDCWFLFSYNATSLLRLSYNISKLILLKFWKELLFVVVNTSCVNRLVSNSRLNLKWQACECVKTLW